ncbi:hypothetical protein H6F42_01455 [Pseudanabaena sp. FACHB-1998]|nr:hypothetical protein [Pseudanabaena sp. FACHB-1998]MBD2175583.1 hypothetical protein [Pseudanabaena sp. FACHB-1998]
MGSFDTKVVRRNRNYALPSTCVVIMSDGIKGLGILIQQVIIRVGQ